MYEHICILHICSIGDLWYRRRQPLAKSMTARRIREFTGNVNTITDDLVKSIYKLRDPETKVVSDVTRLIIRWSFDGRFSQQIFTTKLVGWLIYCYEYDGLKEAQCLSTLVSCGQPQHLSTVAVKILQVKGAE